MAKTERLPFVLTAHAIPHVMGYMATKGGEKAAEPLGPVGLMKTAVDLGLAGIEIPLPSTDSEAVARLRDELQSRDLSLVGDSGVLVDADNLRLRDTLMAFSTLGAKVMRAMISGVLCGDRRKLAGGWDDHLARTAERLRDVLPLAEDLGMCIAIENHQDATSDDLLRLHEMVDRSPAYGVTLDAGNPLAVGEDPVDYASRLGPLLRHVHMKDYTIHFAPEGYRLVRCAAGDGVVDFPAILQIARANGHDVLPGIEVAAQATRTIPMLEAGWWEHYPPEQATRLPGALRVLWAKGRPADEPYSSAWERGEGSATVCAEEWDILHRSAAYFRRIA